MSKKPTKSDFAQMKVLSDLGHTPTAISRRIGKSHHTVIKYLQDPVIFDDPEVKNLIEHIRDKEIDDLFLLGAKARKRLHDLIEEGDTKVIETTAVMDRSFQQRRLLEGSSSINVSIRSVSEDLETTSREIAELEARLKLLQDNE